MSSLPSDVAFTPTVKAIQAAKGSRSAYARMEVGDGWETTVTPELAKFIARQDMFFLGTASAGAQPYIQHRGGPPGFLKVLDEHTLAFADFGGNQQYITLGNLQDNPQAIIFLIDYLERIRIKLWGTARVVEDDPALLERLADPTYSGKVERAIEFTLTAWDRNCPRHIQRRYPQAMIAPVVDHLKAQIAVLEQQIRDLGAEPARPPG
jgi:predicted pyridoxine 5'-phosphate oxidase superfamily flavin-nucleotide-binding protein